MKLRFRLNFDDVHKAMRAFESPKVLDEIYGANNHCFQDWGVDNRRKGVIHGIEVPLVLRPFAGGARASARISEHRKFHGDGRVVIHARVKPAIVGAEFVSCNTYLTLRPGGPKVDLDVDVRSRVLLPPPFRGLSRDFVNMASSLSITKMVEIINRDPSDGVSPCGS